MDIHFPKGKSILANGTHKKVKRAAKRVMVFKYGQTALNLKDSGEMIWLMATVVLFSLMATFSKEIGSTIKLMVKETTSTLKEQLIKVIGTKTNKKVKVGRSGPTAHSSKVNTYEARSTARGSTPT